MCWDIGIRYESGGNGCKCDEELATKVCAKTRDEACCCG